MTALQFPLDFQVFIQSSVGRTTEVQFKSGDTMLCLQQKLSDGEGVPRENIDLVYAGYRLVDADVIDLLAGASLLAVARGGGKSTAPLHHGDKHEDQHEEDCCAGSVDADSITFAGATAGGASMRATSANSEFGVSFEERFSMGHGARRDCDDSSQGAAGNSTESPDRIAEADPQHSTTHTRTSIARAAVDQGGPTSCSKERKSHVGQMQHSGGRRPTDG